MERNNGIPVHLAFSAFFFGIAVGANLHAALESSDTHDANERVKNIQTYNGELQQQLNVGDRIVAHLSVDDKGKHFRFESQTADGTPEQCVGRYELRNKVATISGDLSCSQDVKVEG